MIAFAIIPGIILFIVVWKYDRVEKEPPALLLKLFLFGALTVISAILIRVYGGRVCEGIFGDRWPLLSIAIESFLLTALVQEGGKFLVLRSVTWKNREFNYTFDAIVYSVAVALGFALCLNIAYAFRFGIDGSLIRVIFSVPGHAINAVFMGYFYGLARYAKGEWEDEAVRMHTAEAVIVPTALHGFYDFCISTGRTSYYVIFAAYVIILTIVTVKQFLRMSENSRLIPGMEYTVFQTYPENAGDEESSVKPEPEGTAVSYEKTGDEAGKEGSDESKM